MSPHSSTAPRDVSEPYAEVIGDPVGQSKSPLIHEYWLDRLGLPGGYRRTHVPPELLGDFLRGRRQDPNWRGCNVTVPHKQAIIPLLDRLDEQAAAIGAVNSVVPRRDGLTGYNTDLDGVAAALSHLALEGAKVGLIGAGGAARAAIACFARRRVAEVAILVRNPSKAEPLRAMLPGTHVEIGALGDAPALLAGSALVINASPLGMAGCPAMPRPVIAAVSGLENATLFDMVYTPLETPFLAVAGGRAVDGLTMLVGQASRAFELFFGSPPPVPDRALFDLLGGADGAGSS